MLYWELLDKGQTVTTDVYTCQLRQFTTAIQEKRRRRMQVCLLHDNARPYVASATRQKLEELGWTGLRYPTHHTLPTWRIPTCISSAFSRTTCATRSSETLITSNLGLAGFFGRQPADFWERGI